MSAIRDRVRPIPASELAAMQRDAKSAIEDLRATYIEVSHRNLGRIAALIAANPPHDEAWRTEIYRLAHDLKGQGSTFGHELVSRIAASLCALIRASGTCDDAKFAKRATAHVEAMRVVLEKDIRGPGGEHGAALLKILGAGA
jgi:HPt (histidine-containing phosphotransfer) domain-containing protein